MNENPIAHYELLGQLKYEIERMKQVLIGDSAAPGAMSRLTNMETTVRELEKSLTKTVWIQDSDRSRLKTLVNAVIALCVTSVATLAMLIIQFFAG